MFKRIFAFIIMIFFICFKCLTWVPSTAATGIPAFDAFYYAILQTLGMAYTNGVEMDMAPIIADIRENVPDYLSQPDNALKYFLREYAGKVFENGIIQWNDSAYENVSYAELSAIKLSGTEISTPTLRDIVSQYQTKALDLDYDITTPIDTNAIAFWNKYNSLEIVNYLNKLNYDPTAGDTPNLPTGYEDLLNTKDFVPYTSGVLANIPLIGSDVPVGGKISSGGQTFIRSIFDTVNRDSITYFDTGNSFYVRQFYFSDLCTIRINFENNIYNVNYENFRIRTLPYGNSNLYGVQIWDNGVTADELYFRLYNQLTNAPSFTPTTSFNTLNDSLNYIYNHFRNFNLYVNGELWLSTSNSNYINFGSVPNAVIDNSTDDGKIVSNPIYWVVDNNTGTPIDSQINLDKLIDYLKGVIDGSNDDTSVDFGDLVDAGVIEKQDGTAITDADVIAIPVSDAIDDALADTDALSIPIAIIGDIPPLPDLPPFFPTPDFPEGDPTSGFNGLSVLARIINITNQSLPSDLVLVFYGVIFGAVVLGLIKILHK